MAHTIDPEKCVACGACEAACPESAIKMGEIVYEIAEPKCIDCGTCASECPNGAIAAA
jgi:ferredoxin